jgi:predicted RNase H-like HicB family nuclease
MKKRFLFWQDGRFWIGYLEEYPDYMTQGETLDELKENLKSLFEDIQSDEIPSIIRAGEIEIV